MKKVLVFGGSGFLGSHVCDKLVESNYVVTVFDLFKGKYISENVDFVKGNILSKEKVVEEVKKADIVFNFAGLSDIDHAQSEPIKTIEYNILGNCIILEACRKANIERFIFSSSIYVYSNSGGFYRSSKQACEQYIENYYEKFNLNYTILRYGSLYGPRSDKRNGIFRFVTQALKDKKMIFSGTPESKREFIHVEDAAECSVEILKPEYANQNIILTGNQSCTIQELLKMIREIIKQDIKIEYNTNSDKTHYEMTPYAYNPKYGKKMYPILQRDLGQGILQVIEYISNLDKNS